MEQRRCYLATEDAIEMSDNEKLLLVLFFCKIALPQNVAVAYILS